MLKNLIWPFIYKEWFRKKNAFATLSSFFILSNYIFFSLWAYVYTNIEDPQIFREHYSNCVGMCLPNESTMRVNFSTKILAESLFYNFYFGLMFGIAINKDKIFTFKGLLADNDYIKYFLRLIVYLMCLTPFSLSLIIKFNHPLLLFLKGLSMNLLAGVITFTLYPSILKWLDLYPDIK